MGQDREPAEQPAPKKRVHFVRAKAYPNGSTSPLRHNILQVLGVLKVATVKQVWLLGQPDHEHPNTVASGLRDLAKNKLTEQRGSTSGLPPKPDPADGDTTATKPTRPAKRKPVRPPGAGAKIWGLTDLGLDAAKFDRYAEYFALTYKDPTHDGHPSDADKLPTWRRRYPMAGPDSLAPIALVLAGAGPRGLNNLLNKVQNLTRKHWRPTSLDPYNRNDPFDFTGSIPILACHLDKLTAQGPHAEIWWRFGGHTWETLTNALAHTEYRARVQARLDTEAQAAHKAKEQRLEATRCPSCNRRQDDFDDQRSASDGTKPCWHCRQKAADDAAEKKQQAVRDAHAKRWPCWTCKGPLGGAFDSALELTKEAPADTLECPSCEIDRRNNGLGRLLLPKPTRSEERQARKGQLNDPWWEMRQLHAKQWPAR